MRQWLELKLVPLSMRLPLGVFLEFNSWVHVVSIFKKSAAVLWLSPQYHSSRSACRETIPDDFLSPGFEVLWYCLRGQIPDSPKLHQRTMVQTTICYHSTTCSRHIVDQKCVFWPKVISGRTTWWQHESFALYWPHPNNLPPLSLPVSYVLFKLSLVKALSLPLIQ